MKDSQRNRAPQALRLEALEDRRVMAAGWTNPVRSQDVNADRSISPIDVLLVVNRINVEGSGSLANQVRGAGNPFFDVNADDSVGPIDVLLVINTLNNPAVQIADPSIARAVTADRSIGADGKFYDFDLEQIETLRLEVTNQTNYSELSRFPNLTSLAITNLQRREIALSTLPILPKLRSLEIQAVDLSLSDMPHLAKQTSLQELDLRYSKVPNLNFLSALSGLSDLSIYGAAIEDSTALRGKVIRTDLPRSSPNVDGLDQLVESLQYSPYRIFEYVRNEISFEPYNGAKKDPISVIQSHGGNAWDQARLLKELLGRIGITSQYESGRVEIDEEHFDFLFAWLGVKNLTAAQQLLLEADLSPELRTLSGKQVLGFSHLWVSASMNLPGQGLTTVKLDASWKLQRIQGGTPVAGNPNRYRLDDYLNTDLSLSPSEYFARIVEQSLWSSTDGLTLSSVPYASGIEPVAISSWPLSYEYIVSAGTSTTRNTFADIERHRISLSGLGPDESTFFVDEILHDQLYVAYDGQRSQLLRNGVPISQLDFGASQILLRHFMPGDDIPDEEVFRNIPLNVLIGIDAHHASPRRMVDAQLYYNQMATNVLDGEPVADSERTAALMSLAAETYFQRYVAGLEKINALSHHTSAMNHISVALFSAGQETVTELTVPNAVLNNVTNIDFILSPINPIALDGSTNNVLAVRDIQAAELSAQEHILWESLTNATSISSVKILAEAVKQGIPVIRINQQNRDEVLQSVSSFFGTSYLDEGYEVIVAQNPPILANNFFGSGFLAFHADGRFAAIINSVFNGGSALGVNPGAEQKGGTDKNRTNVGDPIDVSSGNVTREDIDIRLPGVTFPIQFSRYYSSQFSDDLGFGDGWLFSYSDRIIQEAPNRYLWRTDRDERRTFTTDQNGNTLNPAGIFGTFTIQSAGYTYREVNGDTFTFDQQGYLVSALDRFGNGVVLVHDQFGLKRIQDAKLSTRWLEIDRTSQGKLTAVRDFSNRTWQYSHDSQGQLSRVQGPNEVNAPSYEFRYSYFQNPQLNKLLKEVKLPNGSTVSHTYYPNRAGFQSISSSGVIHSVMYDVSRRKSSVVEPNGMFRDYWYDAFGQVSEDVASSGATLRSREWSNGLVTKATDSAGATEEYAYNAQGLPTQHITASGLNVQVAYEPTYGRPLRSDSSGRITQWNYNDSQSKYTVTQPDGAIYAYTLNSLGKVIQEISPIGMANSSLQAQYTTTRTYNLQGQLLTESIGTIGTEKSFEYDVRGNNIRNTDEGGNTETRQFDILGRAIQISDREDRPTSFDYDARGNLLSITDAEGRITAFSYDDDRRLTRISYADGSLEQLVYTPSGEVLASYTTAGTESFTFRDHRGLVNAVANSNQGMTALQVDELQRVVSVVDGVGNRTTFKFDADGRTVSETDALSSRWEARYNVHGEIIGTRDPENRHRTFTYDASGRVVKEEWLDSTSRLVHTITWAYDSNGNLSKVVDGDVITEWEMDNRGNPISETQTVNGLLSTTDWTLDQLGQIIHRTSSMATVDLGSTAYTRNRMGELSSLTLDRVAPLLDAKVVLDRSNTGAVEGIDRFVGDSLSAAHLRSSIQRDIRQRALSIVHQSGNAELLNLNNRYATTGELVRKIENEKTLDFKSDRSGQLVYANYRDPEVGIEQFQYDAAGNIIDLNGSTKNTGPSNQLIEDATYLYRFDKIGNLIERVNKSTAAKTRLEWDTRNRLVKVTELTAQDAVTRTTSYVYDGLDRRLQRTVRGSSGGANTVIQERQTWVYDGLNKVAQILDTDIDSSQDELKIKSFLTGDALDSVYAEVDANGIHWLLRDSLNSVRGSFSDTSQQLTRMDYRVFGSPIQNSNPYPLFGFAGGEFASEIDGYYFRARYYSATQGRFLSQDPLGFSAGDLNLYRYVGNQVLTKIDPTGRIAEEPSQSGANPSGQNTNSDTGKLSDALRPLPILPTAQITSAGTGDL